MAPDFEYFLRLSPEGGFGHTLSGVFVFDLPLAFIALWLFHAYVKEPLYAWLPESVQRRIELGPTALRIKNFAQFAMISLSILIGEATHILWDSFTHPKFWPYRHWQFLHGTVHVPVYGQMEYVRVTQHASTVIGAVVLLLWCRHWFRTTAPTQPAMARNPQDSRRAALLIVCILALAAATVRGLLVLRFGTTSLCGVEKFAFESAVITSIDAFWLGVVVYGALRTLRQNELQKV